MFQNRSDQEKVLGAIGSTRFHFREDSARNPIQPEGKRLTSPLRSPEKLNPIFEELLTDLAESLAYHLETLVAEAYLVCASHKNYLTSEVPRSQATQAKMEIINAISGIHLNAGKVFDNLKIGLSNWPSLIEPIRLGNNSNNAGGSITARNQAKSILSRYFCPQIPSQQAISQGVPKLRAGQKNRDSKAYVEDETCLLNQNAMSPNRVSCHHFERESSKSSSQFSWDSAQIQKPGIFNERPSSEENREYKQHPIDLEKQCLKFDMSDDPFEAILTPNHDSPIQLKSDPSQAEQNFRAISKPKLVLKEEFNPESKKPTLNAKVELFQPKVEIQPSNLKTKLKPSAAFYDPTQAQQASKKLVPTAREFTPQTGGALPQSHSVTQLILPIQQTIPVVGLMPVYTNQRLASESSDYYSDEN